MPLLLELLQDGVSFSGLGSMNSVGWGSARFLKGFTRVTMGYFRGFNLRVLFGIAQTKTTMNMEIDLSLVFCAHGAGSSHLDYRSPRLSNYARRPVSFRTHKPQIPGGASGPSWGHLRGNFCAKSVTTSRTPWLRLSFSSSWWGSCRGLCRCCLAIWDQFLWNPGLGA